MAENEKRTRSQTIVVAAIDLDYSGCLPAGGVVKDEEEAGRRAKDALSHGINNINQIAFSIHLRCGFV